MEQEYILSVQARNHAGVLLRISGLFSRRGYNIKSLIAAQTEDPEYSEIIIVVQGNETVVRLVQHQLLKLIDIERVTLLPKDNIVTREHLLIKVGTVSYTHLDVYKRQGLQHPACHHNRKISGKNAAQQAQDKASDAGYVQFFRRKPGNQESRQGHNHSHDKRIAACHPLSRRSADMKRFHNIRQCRRHRR